MFSKFSQIQIKLASPEEIRSWSYGEVKKPETINYRTQKAERGGLFCEKIFGPQKDYECWCGKYKGRKYDGVECDSCKVEVTSSKVRRERMGHIELQAPVTHIWFLKAIPSYISLALDMSPKDVESVTYYERYVVVDPAKTTLKFKQILTEEEVQRYYEEFGKKKFTVQTGAEAVKALLSKIDLEKDLEEIKKEIQSASLQRLTPLLKRYKIVSEVIKSKNKLDWMVLDVLPVLPPDLRPMVPIDGGRYATSDINDLYRRIINRNNRLKKLLEASAPDIIIKNEKRMLQEAVDALIDNGRRGRVITSSNNRPLKSLTEILKGKQGRFRQNLLGKRVDYSGRSVIVIGPNLKFNQCGIPKMMALELFKPFVMHELQRKGLAPNISTAKRMVERRETEVWDALEEVVQDHPVLLNRAPTLHRLGIQAFEPVLIEGKAIRLHPLVCPAFNADFDGDQMAVHVPLSKMAQLEARFLMLSTNNLLSPSNGAPIVVPTQDIIMGLYYLTVKTEKKGKKTHIFTDVFECLRAYEDGYISLHEEIKVRVKEVSGEGKKREEKSTIYKTSAGRVLLFIELPEGIPFDLINQQLIKSRVEEIVSITFKEHGYYKSVILIDTLKKFGFNYSTKMAASIAVSDIEVSDQRKVLVDKAQGEVDKINSYYETGKMSKTERYNKIIQLWNKATDKIEEAAIHQIAKSQGGFNPVNIMVASGARGSKTQIRQLAGIRGLMAKPSGEIIELPIKANFRDGLTVLEYFISTHGARKGLADTALKTANAGYLTRRLVDVAQEVVVTMDDCKTLNGISVGPIIEGDRIVVSLSERIIGRVAVVDIDHPVTGDIIVKANELIDEDAALKIEDAMGTDEKIKIRSPLTCEAELGVCQKCYGRNLATGLMVELGEAVGIIAAQSIGEPGTQLTMRTFHTGGIATAGTVEDTKFDYNVVVDYVPQKVTRRKEKDQTIKIVMRDSYMIIRKVLKEYDIVKNAKVISEGAWIKEDDTVMTYRDSSKKTTVIKSEVQGYVRLVEKAKKICIVGHEQIIQLPAGAEVEVSEGDYVPAGNLLAEFDRYNEVVLSDHEGKVKYIDIVYGRTVKEKVDPITGQSEKIIVQDKEKEFLPRIEIVKGDKKSFTYDLPYNAYIMVENNHKVRAGDILVKIPTSESKTKDITGGLPRVEMLFEARERKDHKAVISEIDGRVSIKKDSKSKGNRVIEIKPESEKLKKSKTYKIPFGKHLKVASGDVIKAGTALTEGDISPYDVLKVKGLEELQAFLLQEVQGVYRSQGVFISDKHIEIIISQMVKKYEVKDPGDSDYSTGDFIEKMELLKTNKELAKKKKKAVKFDYALLGVSKASIRTTSWISAASFQETRKVLSQASLAGKMDALVGLKENVIIGHLIPAGTGFKKYRKDDYDFTPALDYIEKNFGDEIKEKEAEEAEETQTE